MKITLVNHKNATIGSIDYVPHKGDHLRLPNRIIKPTEILEYVVLKVTTNHDITSNTLFPGILDYTRESVVVSLRFVDRIKLQV